MLFRSNEKINNIKNQFNSILQDFKKYYVYYNKNPEVNEYSNFFYNTKNELNNLNKELLNVSLNIGKDFDKLNNLLNILNKKIDKIKKENQNIELNLLNLENNEEGSLLLINNKKDLYNIQYLKNWILIFSIIFVIINNITYNP